MTCLADAALLSILCAQLSAFALHNGAAEIAEDCPISMRQLKRLSPDVWHNVRDRTDCWRNAGAKPRPKSKATCFTPRDIDQLIRDIAIRNGGALGLHVNVIGGVLADVLERPCSREDPRPPDCPRYWHRHYDEAIHFVDHRLAPKLQDKLRRSCLRRPGGYGHACGEARERWPRILCGTGRPWEWYYHWHALSLTRRVGESPRWPQNLLEPQDAHLILYVAPARATPEPYTIEYKPNCDSISHWPFVTEESDWPPPRQKRRCGTLEPYEWPALPTYDWRVPCEPTKQPSSTGDP